VSGRAEYDSVALCIRSRAVSLIPAAAACAAVGTGYDRVDG
jgi:hypothetical protein